MTRNTKPVEPMWTTTVDPSEYPIDDQMKQMVLMANAEKQCFCEMDVGKVWGLYMAWKELSANAELIGGVAVRSDALLGSCREIANNAIYFDDNSDYRSALREICSTIGMDDDEIGTKFIDPNN